MAGGIGATEGENVYAGYASAAEQQVKQFRAYAAYASTAEQQAKQFRVYAAYVSVMTPVEPTQRRRPGAIISDG